MKLSSKWIGHAVAPSALNLGDLFLINHGSTAFLAMKVEGIENDQPREYVLLLCTYGSSDPDGDPLPRVLYTTNVLGGETALRLVEGGELVVQPVATTTNEVLAPPKGGTPNGGLAICDDGTFAIFVKVSLMPQWFSMATGKPPASTVRVRVDHWRLVWRFGDGEMELCRFPA